MNQKDELVEKTKKRILDIFGPESAIAEAMDDPEFFDKLGELVAWLYGEVMLSQPKPQPRMDEVDPSPFKPTPAVPQPWAEFPKPKWEQWRRADVRTDFQLRWQSITGSSRKWEV